MHPDSPADHSHHLQSLVGSPAPHSALLSIHHQPHCSGLAPLKTARWETSGFKALLGRARDLMWVMVTYTLRGLKGTKGMLQWAPEPIST